MGSEARLDRVDMALTGRAGTIRPRKTTVEIDPATRVRAGGRVVINIGWTLRQPRSPRVAPAPYRHTPVVRVSPAFANSVRARAVADAWKLKFHEPF